VVKDVGDIHLSCHNQNGSRRSQSQVKFHDLLLPYGVGLLLGSIGFAFGSVDAVRNSVLVDDLSGSNTILAKWISVSPEDLVRASALIGSRRIPDKPQASFALTLTIGAGYVVEIVRERLTLPLLGATVGCSRDGEEEEDEAKSLDRHCLV